MRSILAPEGLRREGSALPAFNMTVPASGRFAPSEQTHFVGSGTAERYLKLALQEH